jgi:hypothetical protein
VWGAYAALILRRQHLARKGEGVSRTSRVSHAMGLPSCFLPIPYPHAHPEILQYLQELAYIPRWRGEAKWRLKAANARARVART